jgi:hypothetical protein
MNIINGERRGCCHVVAAPVLSLALHCLRLPLATSSHLKNTRYVSDCSRLSPEQLEQQSAVEKRTARCRMENQRKEAGIATSQSMLAKANVSYRAETPPET